MNRRGFLKLAAMTATAPAAAGCLDFGQYISGEREKLSTDYAERMQETEYAIRNNIVEYDAGFTADIFDEDSVEFDYKIYSENPSSFVLDVKVDTAQGGPYEDLNDYLVGGTDDAVREQVAPVFGQMLEPVVKNLVPTHIADNAGEDGINYVNLTVGNPLNVARLELGLGGRELRELNTSAGPDELYDMVKGDVDTVIVSVANPVEPAYPGGI